MPIVTVFDPDNYLSSTRQILDEWLEDFFPASTYTVTFRPPGAPAKPTVWLQSLPGDNRERFGRDGLGRTVQGKELRYAVSLIAVESDTAEEMAQRFERHAVLGSASALGAKGLRHAEVMPFQDARDPAQPQSFRRSSVLSFTVELRR